jgi:hypothetical protein
MKTLNSSRASSHAPSLTRAGAPRIPAALLTAAVWMIPTAWPGPNRKDQHVDDGAQHRDHRLGGGDLAAVGGRAGVARLDRRYRTRRDLGPFAVGSIISMTPIGRDPVELRIEEAIEPELFIDVAELGAVAVRTIHRVDALENRRNRVVYRMEISGRAADEIGPALGPEISGDFPQTLAALADGAEDCDRRQVSS